MRRVRPARKHVDDIQHRLPWYDRRLIPIDPNRRGMNLWHEVCGKLEVFVSMEIADEAS